jgi:hypothetical protein
MKEKIALWYAQGLWTTEMVQNAVEKNLLTQEEADEILATKS